jgi:hypothetical protein
VHQCGGALVHDRIDCCATAQKQERDIRAAAPGGQNQWGMASGRIFVVEVDVPGCDHARRCGQVAARRRLPQLCLALVLRQIKSI